MSLNGGKVPQIVRNLNTVNVKDGAAYQQLTELWTERIDVGLQSQQMHQTCVSESAPEFVLDVIHG